MKLIFPNGEHKTYALHDGITYIGREADCQIVLSAAGIANRHCAIEFHAGHASVRPLDRSNVTMLNGHQVAQAEAIKAGDLLTIAKISCRIVAIEHAAPISPSKPPVAEDSHTRVRAALPKFVLRGVSGVTFGKTFALVGNMVMGRAHESDISVPSEEVSRNHARLQVTPDGIMVEDLGSANGTWINGKRIHTDLLKPGDELRLDTIRFMLIAPGMDMRQQIAATQHAGKSPESSSRIAKTILWIVVGLGVIALGVFSALRFFGKL